MRNLKMVLGLVCFFQLSVAFAGLKPFEIGEISYAGSGCTPGSLSIRNLSETNIQIDHLDFKAASEGRRIARTNCALRIPVSVAPGFQVALQAVNTGSASLNAASKATVNRELFVSGSTGKAKSLVLTGGTRPFSLKKLSNSELAFSPCGQEAILAMNSAITLISASSSDIAQVDSSRLTLVIRACR